MPVNAVRRQLGGLITLLFFCWFFQSERFPSADFYRSKIQTASQKASPSVFSSLPSFQPLQKQQRPPSDQLVVTQGDGDLLLSALRQYLSRQLSLQGGAVSPEEQGGPSPRLRPYYSNGIEKSGLKAETLNSRPLKMGKAQGASPAAPLTHVDGTCFHRLLMSSLIFYAAFKDVYSCRLETGD